MSKKNRINDSTLVIGAFVLLLLLAFAFYKGNSGSAEDVPTSTVDTTQVDTPKSEIDTVLIND